MLIDYHIVHLDLLVNLTTKIYSTWLIMVETNWDWKNLKLEVTIGWWSSDSQTRLLQELDPKS
jgi:hypothetical protein